MKNIKYYRQFSVYFILLFLFSLVANGQNTALQNLALQCDSIVQADTANGNRICSQLVAFAETGSDLREKAEAYRLAGNCSGKLENFENAFGWLQKAAEISRESDSPESQLILGKTLVNLGAICHQNGDFNTALSYYLEAEKIFFIQNNISWLIRTYASLGDLYDKISQPEKRKEINEKAFELLSQTSDIEAQIKAYTCKANNLSNEDRFEEALDLYKKTLTLSQSLKNYHLEHVAWYNMGFALSRMDNYNEAAAMYLKSYEAANAGGNKSDMGDALYKTGLMNFYSEKFLLSEEYLSQAMQIANETNSNILKRNVYDVLYSLEEARGNYKKAYEYLNDYVDVEFEIFSEDDLRQTNFLQARFEADKREFQITQLENEKQIQQLNLKRQKLLIVILVLGLLLGAMFLLLVIRKNIHKQQLAAKQAELQNQKIEQMEKEHQLLAVQSVLKGEEAERSRIATDLHDGLGGLLSGVKINLSSMKEKAVLTENQVRAFNHALSLLDNSIGELRRIAHNMMPETLHKYGLKTAFADFCVEMGHGETEINFGFFGENKRYNSELELTVYRIGQELVNNSLKHAGAGQINVQMFAETSRIALQVFDNGCGFNPAEKGNMAKSKGIDNIKSRVAAFNGLIEINSAPGQGTEILLEFPVNDKS